MLTARAVLQHNFLFQGVPEKQLDELAALARTQKFDKGAIVFNQGDEGDALYGVAAGRIRVSVSDESGREVFLNHLSPGETFGEIALLDGLPRTASAIAATASTLVSIARSTFISHLANDASLGMHLIELLCQRLRWVSERVEEDTFLAGPARAARRLYMLAENFGLPARGGDIELTISQAELAQFLGMSRQMVNQYLQDWVKAGWITLSRGHVVVHEPGEIRNLSQSATH